MNDYSKVKNPLVTHTHVCFTAGAWQCRPAMRAPQTGETSPVYSRTGQGPGGRAEGGEGRSHAGSTSLPAGSRAHQRCDEGSQFFPSSPRRTDRYRHSFSSGTKNLSAGTFMSPGCTFHSHKSLIIREKDDKELISAILWNIIYYILSSEYKM